MTKPIVFDSHMHTTLCRHAEGDPLEYVAHGVRMGLKGVIFTCHSPHPDRFSHAVRMRPEEFAEYVRIIDHARENAPDGFEVRLGMESDWFPGQEDWLRDLHDSADFHYVLGSVHWHIPEYEAAFYTGDINAFQTGYFDHLTQSAECGLFDCLSHPDLIKNAQPDDWFFEEHRKTIGAALDRIAKTGVAMELNTSGQHKIFPQNNPGPNMLTMMADRGIPVVVGSDSHEPNRVGESFLKAFAALEKAGYDSISVFKNRVREEIPIPEARASLGGDPFDD